MYSQSLCNEVYIRYIMQSLHCIYNLSLYCLECIWKLYIYEILKNWFYFTKFQKIIINLLINLLILLSKRKISSSIWRNLCSSFSYKPISLFCQNWLKISFCSMINSYCFGLIVIGCTRFLFFVFFLLLLLNRHISLKQRIIYCLVIRIPISGTEVQGEKETEVERDREWEKTQSERKRNA